ncbi:Ku protein [Streptomyces sp. NPDC002092]
MLERPVWVGVVTLRLVTVPVALSTAIEDRTVHFHQLQRGTSDRIRNKRVNERTGKEVDTGGIVKGCTWSTPSGAARRSSARTSRRTPPTSSTSWTPCGRASKEPAPRTPAAAGRAEKSIS